MIRYYSPLRYPGGKGKLAPYIRAIIQQNRLEDGHYAEPYAGGASVALDLLFNEYVRRIHINDLDRSVFAFWHSVLNEADALCTRVETCSLTPTEWRRQRQVQDEKEHADLLDLGFSTFFLNRTSRSGIISSSGIIGGKDQTGPWKMDARFNRHELALRIRRIAALRDRISLTQLDAADFLAELAGSLTSRSLTYLDPPYYVKGQQRLYANYYKAADHAHIASLLDAYPHCWVVSYDYAPEILEHYHDYRCVVYGLKYSATERYSGSEVMFFCDQIQIPEMSEHVGKSVSLEQ